MYTIKHFVIIRFFCLDMCKREELFSYQLLHNAITVFKKYTLKSLENQTNKNFEIVLMIHNEIDVKHKAIVELQNIVTNIKINIIRFNEIYDFIKDTTNDYDFCITTRIDYDDLIYNGAIEEIQSKCNINCPIYFNGYVNGITMINDDFVNTYKCYLSYPWDKFGSMSIFQSLIINKKLLPNCNLTAYLGDHTHVSFNINKLCEFQKIVYDDKYINVNLLEDAFLYVNTHNNASIIMNTSLDNNWHKTNIKVNKSKEWFTERFGNFIN